MSTTTPAAKCKPPPARPAPAFATADGRGRLYVGDACDVVPRIDPAVRPDLIFADPPFNIGQTYGADGETFTDGMSRADYYAFTRRWVSACAARLRPGGSMFVHGPGPVAAVAYLHMEAVGLEPVNWIVLHQEFGQYRETAFINSHVHLLYFAKAGGPRTWNVGEVLVPSRRLESGDPRTAAAKHKGLRPMLDVWFGDHLGRVQGNNRERWNPRLHPNQLPERYVARVVRVASAAGDLVMDPFNGSGTTGAVSLALGRRYAGVELLPKVAASAWRRILRGPVRDVTREPAAAAPVADDAVSTSPAATVVRPRQPGRVRP